MPCVKLLIENGAILMQDRFGCLAIHDAVRCGHKEVADHLRLMDINLEISQDFGDSPRDILFLVTL